MLTIVLITSLIHVLLENFILTVRTTSEKDVLHKFCIKLHRYCDNYGMKRTTKYKFYVHNKKTVSMFALTVIKNDEQEQNTEDQINF
jgi:hypothetical protein